MLREAEAQAIRRALGTLLADGADIFRPTYTKGPGGGRSEATTTIATGVPCSVAPVTGPKLTAIAGRMEPTRAAHIYLPAGQDVKPGDSVRTGGIMFLVHGVQVRAPDRQFLTMAIAEAQG